MDLNPEDIQVLAKAQGFDIEENDLAEVTHRFNALQEALRTLDHPDLDSVEPVPIFP